MAPENEPADSARCEKHGLNFDPAAGCPMCNSFTKPAPTSSAPVVGVAAKSPTTALLLYFVTCGLYEIFVWMPDRIRAANSLLGRQEFEYGKVLLLSIVTCGVMYMYYEYQMGVAINEAKRARGLSVSDSLPMVTVLFDIFGLSFISSFMHQEELNRMLS